jgi:energy-coupling factor transporter ATP-binding protein EcfA2
MLRHIEYAASLDNKHLLLDEWDANLDQENILKINDLLNRISKDKVIIEVRHR